MPCKPQIQKYQRGSILIFALLLTTGLLAVALGLANLLMPELSIARSLNDGVNAFYASESCVENGLMQFIRIKNGDATKVNDSKLDPTLVFPSGATCTIDNQKAEGFRSRGSYKRSFQALTIEGLSPCGPSPLPACPP